MTARHQRFTATSDLIKRGEACSAIWIWKGPSGKPSRVSFPGPFAGAWWCNVQASASLLLKSLGVLEMGNTFYWGRSWVKQLPLNLLQLLSTDFSFQGALFCGTGVRSLCIWKFDLFFFSHKNHIWHKIDTNSSLGETRDVNHTRTEHPGADLSSGWRGNSVSLSEFEKLGVLSRTICWICWSCQAFQPAWEVHCQALCPGQVEEGFDLSFWMLFERKTVNLPISRCWLTTWSQSATQCMGTICT